jgi:hypothetical protein
VNIHPDILQTQLDRLVGFAAAGSEVPISELVHLSNALRANAYKSSLVKAGITGTLQGVPFDSSTIPGSEYAPLVPQSIQPIWDNVTAREEDLVLQKKIVSSDVTAPVFEYTQLRKYGGTAVSPFVSEVGVPAITNSDYARQTVRMKYMAVFRQLTDVLMNTQLLPSIGQARAVEAANGSFSLAMMHERFLFWADSAINPLEYDGILASVERREPENVIDMEGRTPSGLELQSYLGILVSPPIYGRPKEVLMAPRHYQWYNNSLYPLKRADAVSDGPLTLNTKGITIGTSRGSIPFQEVPFLAWDENPILRTEGDGPPSPLVPVLTAVAGGTSSKWRAADVNGRSFYYTFEMVGDNGATRTVNVGPINLVAGESVQVDFPDSNAQSMDALSIRSYNVFRADVPAGDPAPTDSRLYYFCGRYGRNAANAGDTRFVDHNHTRPRTSPIVILQYESDVLEWKSFLPVTMRPITISRSRTEQFLLTMFGALKVSNPKRILVLKNVGYG